MKFIRTHGKLPSATRSALGILFIKIKESFFVVILSAYPIIAPACSSAEAQIKILPFTVTEDFSRGFKVLSEENTQEHVGMVKTISSINVDGCVAIVGYRDPVLYIARELIANDCAFKHVYQHEQHHIQIYLQALATLETRIRSALGHQSLYNAAVEQVLAVKAIHDSFDSEDEIDQNNTACEGQITALLRHRY